MTTHKKQISLSLGSGGARGLAHIGVIKALEENRIPINIITGTSIGAFIGGLYASGMDVKSMESIVREVDKIMVAKIMMPKFFAPGFIDNSRVFDFIKGFVGEVKIENLEIPFSAIATDMITGEEVVFNKGLLIDAIMASIAIPMIFQPVLLDNRYLLDGGLSNPLPISVAKKMGAQKIIAVNVSPNPRRITQKFKIKKTKEVNQFIKILPTMVSNLISDGMNLFSKNELVSKINDSVVSQSYSPTLMNVFLQSISISTNNLMEQHLRYAKPDILISPRIEEFDMLEFYNGLEIIECGYEETIKTIKRINVCLDLEV